MNDKETTNQDSGEEFDDELPEDLVDGEFDPDDVGDDDDSVMSEGNDESDEEEEDGPRPVAVSEDDEDEPDPSDVEADLDEILRDRIAAGDDDEEEEGEPELVQAAGDVEGRRESEINCPNCFLLVTVDTVTATGECPHCGGPIP